MKNFNTRLTQVCSDEVQPARTLKTPAGERKPAWVLRHVDPIILRKYGMKKWERQRNRIVHAPWKDT